MIEPPIVLIALGGFLGDGSSKLALFVQQPLLGVVIEKADFVPALLQLLDGPSSNLCAFMDADRDYCVDFRTCNLLKQFRALALGSEKEGIEFALSEEHRSPELIECKVGSRFYRVANLSLARRHGAPVVKPVQRALFILEPPICPAARAIGLPADAVALAILPDEIYFGISTTGASAQDRAALLTDRKSGG